jgi:hypothetical protein
MARTIQQIYDALIIEKNNQTALNTLQPSIDSAQTLLSDVSSSSAVADWRLWLWLVAFGCFVLETYFDLFKVDVAAINANNQYGTPQWWKAQTLKFQFGYQLVLINGIYQYATINPAAQIINQVAVVSLDSGGMIIKVAKVIAGVLTPLTNEELQAFILYTKKIRPSGIAVSSVSSPPDKLKIGYTIYYDASFALAVVKASVEAAINTYLNNLPFNGELALVFLTDAIQKAIGVVIPQLTTSEATVGSIPYTPFNIKYLTSSGYIVIDPAFPLNTQITYVANV